MLAQASVTKNGTYGSGSPRSAGGVANWAQPPIVLDHVALRLLLYVAATRTAKAYHEELSGEAEVRVSLAVGVWRLLTGAPPR